MKPTVLMLFLVLSVSRMSAQMSETYFSDAETKEGGTIRDHIKYNNTIIIAGQSFSKAKNQPAVMRLDTLGNVLWNTALTDTAHYSPYDNTRAYHVIASGADLYVMVAADNRYMIWKLDAATGAFKWRKSFYSTFYLPPQPLVDYDATRLLLGYEVNAGVNKLAWISKATGDTLKTHLMGTGYYTAIAVAADTQKNIYYTYRDTVYKLGPSNPDSVLWKMNYPGALLEELQHAYVDANDSLYLFGSKLNSNQGKVLAVNKTTGALIWNVTGLYGDVRYADMADKNGSLYVTWQHIYVGGTIFSWITMKIPKASGVASWDSRYEFTGVGAPATTGHSGSGESARSLDVDDNGDVYLTGYYGDANYGPEQWGILKLDNADGSPLYEKTITNDSVTYNDLSWGLAACVFNNSPYYVGELQTTFQNNERSTPTFVKTDASGNVLIKKYFGGEYQYPSRALAITAYDANNTLVLKQVGRKLSLEKYNQYKTLAWQKTFAKEYYLTGQNITVAPGGDILVSSYSSSESNDTPFYNHVVDSMMIYRLDGGGILKNTYVIPVDTLSFAPVDLFSDGTVSFVIYKRGNRVYYRKIDGGGVSAEYNPQLTWYSGMGKVCYNRNANKAVLFGLRSGREWVMELDKATGNATVVDTLGTALYNIYGGLQVDTNKILLCGKSQVNAESIGLYNLTATDTTWTKQPSPYFSEAIKCVADPQLQYLYTVSHHQQSVAVRKNRISDGHPVWSYAYTSNVNEDDVPVDVSYDNFAHRLLVTGFETGNSINRVLILVVDSSGVPLDTIVKAGDFTGDARGLCTGALADGSLWVGGNLNKNVYGLAGFVFDLYGSGPTKIIPVGKKEACAVHVFPNPCTDVAVVELCKETHGGAQLSLFNIYGQLVRELDISGSSPVLLHREGLASGLYIYRVNTAEGLTGSGKLVLE